MVTIPLGKDHLSDTEYTLYEPEDGETGTEAIQLEQETLSSRETQVMAYSILVAEDNKEVRKFIQESVDQEYSVLLAEDGLQAWNMVTSEIPDLVITDIMMPVMDGLELCKKIKQDDRTSHIQVIMLTARAMSQDKIKGLKTGADDYIIKPFSVDEMRVRVNNLIEQREKLRKKYAEQIHLDWGELIVTSPDEQFLKNLTGIVKEHMQDAAFDVRALQSRFAMSPNNLYKKLKALTGYSAVELIRVMRLHHAKSLIKQNKLRITEILMEAGFSNHSYFSKCFKKQFGMSPKEYQKSLL